MRHGRTGGAGRRVSPARNRTRAALLAPLLAAALAVPSSAASSPEKGKSLRAVTAPGAIDGGLAARARAERSRAALEAAAGLARRGETAPALRALESIVAADPGNLEARNWLGSIYVELGRHETALAQFEAVRKLQPAAVWHYYDGEALLGRERMGEALDAFKAALADGPGKNRGEDVSAKVKDRVARLE